MKVIKENSQLNKRKNKRNLHRADNGEVSTELLVDHEAEDAHHGGTAVVELNGTLGKLGLLIKGVPAVVEGPVAEVPGELGLSGDILHDGELESTDGEEELDESTLGDSIGSRDGGPSVSDGIEGSAGVVNVSRKVDAVAGYDLSEEGELGDTAVLDLDVTEAVEAVLVGVSEHAEGIEESEGSLFLFFSLSGVRGGFGQVGTK